MASAAGPTSERQDTTVPDEDHGVDIPMTMSASVVLTSLPSDATQALAQVDAMDERKGTLPASSVLLEGKREDCGAID